MPDHSADRAVLFVDGSNFYHGCSTLGLTGLGRLNYAKVSLKLAGPRAWVATRYYVGQVPGTGNLRLAEAQQKFLEFLRTCDARMTVHMGRIEPRPAKSQAAVELGRYLAGLKSGSIRWFTASWLRSRPALPRQPRWSRRPST